MGIPRNNQSLQAEKEFRAEMFLVCPIISALSPFYFMTARNLEETRMHNKALLPGAGFIY